MKEKENKIRLIPNHEGSSPVSITIHNRRGPIGTSARIKDFLRESLAADVKLKKVARRVEGILTDGRKKDMSDSILRLYQIVELESDLGDLFSKIIPLFTNENVKAALSSATIRYGNGEKFAGKPKKGKNKDTNVKVSETKVMLLKKLPKDLEDRTPTEIFKDELEHRPALIAARMKTSATMMKFRLRHMFGL